jgi:hypothetical protein
MSTVSLTITDSPEISSRCSALEIDPDLVSLRVLRSDQEIEDIRDIWTRWHRHPNSDIDFFLMICRLRPEVLRPHVIVVYRGDSPDCLLVGRLEQSCLNFRIGYATPFRPEARVLTLVYGGFLGNTSAENSHVLARVIMNMLHRGEIDLAHFHHLRVGSPLYSAVRRAPAFQFCDHFPAVEPHWHLALPGTFNEYFESLPGKQRHEYRRHLKHLDRKFPGKVRIRCFEDESEIDQLARDAESVANQTYQRRLGVGFRDGSEIRYVLAFAARRNALHACVLYIEDEPRAFLIGHLDQHILFAHSMGYDPKFAKFSIGSLLLMRWMEEALSRRPRGSVTHVDFCSGDARYKREVCNQEWHEASLYLFGQSRKGLRLSLLRMLSSVSHALGNYLLCRARLLDGVKRAWRRAFSS